MSLKVKSTCGQYIYHFSIIDYLSTFGNRKRLEIWGKSWFHNVSTYDISAMAPIPYGNRFLRFINKYVLKYDETNQIDEMNEMMFGKMGNIESPDPWSKEYVSSPDTPLR